MSKWKIGLFLPALLFAAWTAPAAPPASMSAAKPTASAADDSMRLYALDCGHMDFKSLGMFSDTGDYDGKPGRVVSPCYLIHHPQGWMLWDAGLGDKIAQAKDGIDLLNGLVHEQVPVTLAAQLDTLGLKPKDIRVVAFSHLHEDNVGNANLFAHSTWIVNDTEFAWARSERSPVSVDPALFAAVDSADVRHIDGDADVFGDGRIIILKAPGHTPGHQVLLLRLKNAGAVILAGGLYPLRENRAKKFVPSINVSRADTLATMDRIEKIAVNQKARVIAQGDPADFAALPKFPAYLD